jgi:peptidoglycan/LPS O-acetylase OafA/YrhL
MLALTILWIAFIGLIIYLKEEGAKMLWLGLLIMVNLTSLFLFFLPQP